MARTRSLENLILGARRLSDVETELDRHPDSDLTDYANKGVAWAWDTLTTIRGYDYYGRVWRILGDVVSSGTLPPDVTFAGSPVDEWVLVVHITGYSSVGPVNTYSASIDGGATILATGSFNPTLGLADIEIAGTGCSFTFPAGVYLPDNPGFGYVAATWTCRAVLPTVAPGIAWVALPGDVRTVHSVAMATPSGSTTSLYKLRPVSQEDEAELHGITPARVLAPECYRVRGSGGAGAGVFGNAGIRLDLFPTPQIASRIEVRYVPHAGQLEDDDDVFDGINGYEDAVEIYMSMLIAEKDDMPATVSRRMAQLEEWTKRMKGAVNRTVGDPVRVKTTRGKTWPGPAALSARAGRYGW